MGAGGNNAFGIMLRRRRKQRMLTQARLAEKSGLSERGISDLERGLNLPRAQTLECLAQALALTADERAAFAATASAHEASASAASLEFNQAVKALRKRAKLTQRQFASALGPGCSFATIARWERGAPIPADFRQRLTQIFERQFGQPAEELGLLWQPSTWRDEAPEGAQAAETIAGAANTAQARRLSTLGLPITLPDPPTDDGLVGRGELLAACREGLQRSRYVALYGLPGVGKSTLALALAHDSTLRRRYGKRILFAALGPEPDIVSLLGGWGAQLRLVSADAANAIDAAGWARALHATIDKRQMLIIVDDVWQIEHFNSLKVGGPNCVYLVTTRSPRVASAIAGAEAIPVNELPTAEGVALLQRLAPQISEADPRAAQSLTQSVGGLPLALQIMGAYLRMETASGQPRRLQAAITSLHRATARIHMRHAMAPVDHPPALRPDTPLSLEVVIDISAQQLIRYHSDGEEALQALRLLSVFPPKPSAFSEGAAIAVTRSSGKALDLLYDCGLLEVSGRGRYALHQVMHSYARLRLPEDELVGAQRRMLDYYAALLEQPSTTHELLTLEANNILAALRAAAQRPVSHAFVRAVIAFTPFLEMRGGYRELGLLLRQAEDMAVALADAPALARIRLFTGRLAELRGEYTLAIRLYESGSELAEQSQHAQLRIALLARRAEVALRRGNSRDAEQLASDGLMQSHAIGDQSHVALLLRIIAQSAGNRGDLAVGDDLYPAALRLAEKTDDVETAISCLQNLGTIAFKHGEYEQALAYLNDGLARARHVGHVRRIVALQNALGCVHMQYASTQVGSEREKWLRSAEKRLTSCLNQATNYELPQWMNNALQNLGALERGRKRFPMAERYLRQALSIAQSLGDRWLVGETECELGDLFLEMADHDRALAAFEAALAVADEGGDTELELDALARYGLGRVWAAKGNVRKARKYGMMSLERLTKLQFDRASEVEAWLQALSSTE